MQHLEKIAGRINPEMVDWLCRRHMEGEQPGDWSTGKYSITFNETAE